MALKPMAITKPVNLPGMSSSTSTSSSTSVGHKRSRSIPTGIIGPSKRAKCSRYQSIHLMLPAMQAFLMQPHVFNSEEHLNEQVRRLVCKANDLYKCFATFAGAQGGLKFQLIDLIDMIDASGDVLKMRVFEAKSDTLDGLDHKMKAGWLIGARLLSGLNRWSHRKKHRHNSNRAFIWPFHDDDDDDIGMDRRRCLECGQYVPACKINRFRLEYGWSSYEVQANIDEKTVNATAGMLDALINARCMIDRKELAQELFVLLRIKEERERRGIFESMLVRATVLPVLPPDERYSVVTTPYDGDGVVAASVYVVPPNSRGSRICSFLRESE
jgi:hypothetical protein